MKKKALVAVVGTVVVAVVGAGGGLVAGGLFLGDLAQRVSGVEEEVTTKLDKPIPEIACESYNSTSASILDRDNICPADQFRFADWFSGDIEHKNERWTLCCRYITPVPHNLE